MEEEDETTMDDREIIKIALTNDNFPRCIYKSTFPTYATAAI